MNNANAASLATSLVQIGAVQFGDFVLHSGQRSSVYLDLRLLVSFPHALRQAAHAYAQILQTLSFDLLAAYPYAALPIGVAIALEMNRPLIYPRKEIKAYGTGKQIEGQWQPGQRAVLIEDLITSGDSILQAMDILGQEGLATRDVVVLIDRQQGGRETLQARGYELHAVMTLAQVMGARHQA